MYYVFTNITRNIPHSHAYTYIYCDIANKLIFVISQRYLPEMPTLFT